MASWQLWCEMGTMLTIKWSLNDEIMFFVISYAFLMHWIPSYMLIDTFKYLFLVPKLSLYANLWIFQRYNAKKKTIYSSDSYLFTKQNIFGNVQIENHLQTTTEMFLIILTLYQMKKFWIWPNRKHLQTTN